MKNLIYLLALFVSTQVVNAQSLNNFDTSFSFDVKESNNLLQMNTGQPPRVAGGGCQRQVNGQGFTINDGSVAYRMSNGGNNTRIGIKEDSINITVDHGCSSIYDNRREVSDRVVEYEITSESVGFNITRSIGN